MKLATTMLTTTLVAAILLALGTTLRAEAIGYTDYTYTPEPATFALAFLALIGLWPSIWRKCNGCHRRCG